MNTLTFITTHLIYFFEIDDPLHSLALYKFWHNARPFGGFGYLCSPKIAPPMQKAAFSNHSWGFILRWNLRWFSSDSWWNRIHYVNPMEADLVIAISLDTKHARLSHILFIPHYLDEIVSSTPTFLPPNTLYYIIINHSLHKTSLVPILSP